MNINVSEGFLKKVEAMKAKKKSLEASGLLEHKDWNGFINELARNHQTFPPDLAQGWNFSEAKVEGDVVNVYFKSGATAGAVRSFAIPQSDVIEGLNSAKTAD